MRDVQLFWACMAATLVIVFAAVGSAALIQSFWLI